MNLPEHKNRSNRSPAVLLPYQQRWAGDHSEVKVIEKSRRVGLSWGEAADCVTTAAKSDGEDCWYIGYTKDMAEEFILDCADWAKHLHQAVSSVEEYDEIWQDGDEEKSCRAFRITFASGWRISALSSSPRNLRGKQGRVIIDEAAFHDDLAELLKAALALLMWGGRVHIISTHNGDENPFNELVQECRAGKKPYSLHRVTFDDAVGEGLYQRICLRKRQEWSISAEVQWVADMRRFYGDDSDEELDCIPARGGGVWLSRALIEARMNPDLPIVRWTAPDGMDLWTDDQIHREVDQFCKLELQPLLADLDPNATSMVGEDFGRYSDLTVLAPLQLTRLLKRRFPFLLELANAPFEAQKRIVFYVCDRLPRFSKGMFDAGGNGSYMAEEARRRYGEQIIEQIVFSEPWYRDNTAPLKARFEDGSIELPLDADVQNDLASFRKIKGVPRLPEVRTKAANGLKRHGDAGIAILLADAASRCEVYQPFAYEAVRPGSSARNRPVMHADHYDYDDASTGWRQSGVI